MESAWRSVVALTGGVVGAGVPMAVVSSVGPPTARSPQAVYPGGRPPDVHLSEFLSMMDLCFLDWSGENSTQVEVSIPALGTMHLTQLCCKESRVQGFGIEATAEDEDEADPEIWDGDMRFDVRLRHVQTFCRATFDWRKRSELMAEAFQRELDENDITALKFANAGSFEMRLGTVDKVDRDFLRFSVSLAGSPMELGGATHPWPRSVKRTECSAGIEISELRFAGAGSLSLNSIAAATMSLQGVLRSVLCGQVQRELRQAVDAALSDAEALIREAPQDLEAPTPPAGAGPSFDLRDAGAMTFVRRLVEDGINSGALARLLDRITDGTGRKHVKVGESGAELLRVDLERPSALSVSAFLDDVNVGGLNSLVGANMDIMSSDAFSFTWSQRRFNLATWFRAHAAVSGSSPTGGAPVLWKAATGALAERFGFRLVLSNIFVGGRIGLLVDKARTAELLEGTSWYEDACFNSMIQNMSIMGLDVALSVDAHKWESDVDSADELEADFSRSINSVSRLFNARTIRPMISRLLRGIIGGPLRDAINAQIQESLTQPPASECENIIGSGSVVACAVLSGLAGFFVLGVFASRRTARRSPAAAAAAAERRGILFLAVAALCLIVGGILAWPMRAAVRMHVPGRSWLMYVYAIDFLETPDYMPFACGALGLSLLFAFSRILVVIAACLATPGAPPRSAKLLRWMTAMGACQYGLFFFVVGPEISSFYTKILTFGPTYMDLGAQINNGFYVCLLGFVLADVAAISARLETVGRVSTPPAARPRGPPILAMVGLLLCLAALVIAPWVTLWTHDYTGALNVVLRYDEHTWRQAVSIASMFNTIHVRDLNPRSLVGIGDSLLQALFFVVVVFAPLAHVALAIVAGFSLRSGAAMAAAVPVVLGDTAAERRINASWRGGVPLNPEGQAPRRSVSDRIPLPPKATVSPRLRRALLVARSMAGVDAFAACMLLVVPDLGSQLDMMTRRPCRPLEPALERIDTECMVLTSSVSIGLPLLLLVGLSARLLAEVAAHAPLRCA